MRSGLDQLLRTIFPVEQVHVGTDVNFQGTGTSSTGVAGRNDAAANAETESRVGDEGAFLSNLLHNIMPLISQSSALGSSDSAPDQADIENTNGQDSTTHVSTIHSIIVLNCYLSKFRFLFYLPGKISYLLGNLVSNCKHLSLEEWSMKPADVI